MAATHEFGTVSPADVKDVVGGINKRFRGYGQQDAHEFLRFLMDGLHEDLNRVHERPWSLHLPLLP